MCPFGVFLKCAECAPPLNCSQSPSINFHHLAPSFSFPSTLLSAKPGLEAAADRFRRCRHRLIGLRRVEAGMGSSRGSRETLNSRQAVTRQQPAGAMAVVESKFQSEGSRWKCELCGQRAWAGDGMAVCERQQRDWSRRV
ncbi:hypothetical protein NL676_034604 [Syzygium grande]|nr:hypothetical protein NL676_034604 [Syzygium grande]